ncbi:PPOX class F420-dependent oxidoreductase [Actinomadura fulvescens]|uniref:PPOX class F420-dependent oxidoreductase n=1 Tax=Actinomadura fulvescens TaxID=46160 RepID=A0ABN3Q402_9ACTN
MVVRFSEEVRPLLDGANYGHLCTLMPDGSPQSTVVWVERVADRVRINMAKGRVKYHNVLRDPRVALSVRDRDDPSTYVQIRGIGRLIEDGAVEHVHRLSRKYVGRDYSDIDTDPPRIILEITPLSVHYHHHD